MIKYKASNWYSTVTIKSVECERETANSVFINGNKNAKVTQRDRYVDTWDEAKAWLLECATFEAQTARRQLEQANGKLGNVKGMKP